MGRSSGAQAGRIPSSCFCRAGLDRRHVPSLQGRRGFTSGRDRSVRPVREQKLLSEDRSSRLTTRWTEDAAPDKRRRPSITKPEERPKPAWGKGGGTPPPEREASTTRPRYPTGQGSPDTT